MRFWMESVPYAMTVILGLFIFAAWMEGVL
jgi:hypothetical protein